MRVPHHLYLLEGDHSADDQVVDPAGEEVAREAPSAPKRAMYRTTVI